MPAGRPKTAEAGTLYSFAHQFYWDFRRIAEGRTRVRFNKERFARLVARIRRLPLRVSDANKRRIAEFVDSEVRNNRLSPEDRENRIRSAEQSQIFVDRDWLLERAADRCRIPVRVPGEPDVIGELLAAQTGDEVRAICRDAFSEGPRQIEPGIVRIVKLPNWPISIGSVLPSYLSDHAEEFIAAKNNTRFPKSKSRPSTRLKQLWFISRALAGALFGVQTRTAINLVGGKLPDQIFEESRAGKSMRARHKHKSRSLRE